MKIAIGCDEAAWDMKQAIGAELRRQGHEVIDHGTHDGAPVLYPDIAVAVAEGVARGEAERGLLFCGTGIGMAISANKVPGIRAAQTHDTCSAERAAKSNDAHIITLGARVVGTELAKTIANAWLASEFDPAGPSAANVAAIGALDSKYRK